MSHLFISRCVLLFGPAGPVVDYLGENAKTSVEPVGNRFRSSHSGVTISTSVSIQIPLLAASRFAYTSVWRN